MGFVKKTMLEDEYERQREEEEECRLRGEPYFRPRNLILNPPLLIRKERKTMESTHAGRNEN